MVNRTPQEDLTTAVKSLTEKVVNLTIRISPIIALGVRIEKMQQAAASQGRELIKSLENVRTVTDDLNTNIIALGTEHFENLRVGFTKTNKELLGLQIRMRQTGQSTEGLRALMIQQVALGGVTQNRMNFLAMVIEETSLSYRRVTEDVVRGLRALDERLIAFAGFTGTSEKLIAAMGTLAAQVGPALTTQLNRFINFILGPRGFTAAFALGVGELRRQIITGQAGEAALRRLIVQVGGVVRRLVPPGEDITISLARLQAFGGENLLVTKALVRALRTNIAQTGVPLIQSMRTLTGAIERLLDPLTQILTPAISVLTTSLKVLTDLFSARVLGAGLVGLLASRIGRMFGGRIGSLIGGVLGFGGSLLAMSDTLGKSKKILSDIEENTRNTAKKKDFIPSNYYTLLGEQMRTAFEQNLSMDAMLAGIREQVSKLDEVKEAIISTKALKDPTDSALGRSR
jgi:hypothetical protein